MKRNFVIFNVFAVLFCTVEGWRRMTIILTDILFYIIIRVRSAFSLVASCVLLKYTRTDDVN